MCTVPQCSSNSSYQDSSHIHAAPLQTATREAIKQLVPKQPFVHLNLGLSGADEQVLQKLNVARTEDYGNFGNLDVLEEGIADFLKNVGNNDQKTAEEAAVIITKLVRSVLTGCQKESAWVALRAFVATDEYNQPRWHRDGYYFPPFSGAPFKFIATLKGAPTLFYELPAAIRERFEMLEEQQNRAGLADLLDPSLAQTSGFGQGSVFIVGAKFAAVHSEPVIRGQRLFLSVLPGSRAEIKELDQRWNPPEALN